MASYFKSRGVIRPHPYQREALASLLWGMRRCRFKNLESEFQWIGGEPGRSQICVLPTGTGKTIVFGFLAGFLVSLKRRPRRILILAHRDRLIKQACEKLAFLGIPLAVEKAERKAKHHLAIAPETRVVVGSVQTLRDARLESWPQDFFDVIVVDEGHRAKAKSYRAIFDWFVRAKIIGVTATDRAKGGLGSVYDRKAYEMTLVEAIGAPAPGPWLAPVLGVRADVKVNLKGIKSKGGDFDVGQLDERISLVLGPLAVATRKEIGDRKTIAFTPDIKTAHAFAEALRQLGVRAAATHGTDPNQSRVLEQYEAGEYQVLVNCDLLTEGYDHPPIAAVVIARPTQSSTLMMQMIGRGTRLHPESGKRDCLIIDFGWEVDQDKVKTILDLFAGDRNPDDVAAAKKRLESSLPGTPIDPQELLDKAKQARETKERKRHADRIRVKVKDREVKYRRVTFDVVAVRNLVGTRPVAAREGVVAMPVSADVAARLKGLGFDSTAGMGQRDAEAMLGRLEERKLCGMATLPQIKLLSRSGHDPAAAARLTSAEAGALIGPLMQRFKGQRSG